MKHRWAAAFAFLLTGVATAQSVFAPAAIHAEFDHLTKVWGINAKLELTEGSEFASSPDGSVVVGIGRLKHDLRGRSPAEQRHLLRFYLAHEIWHQWQFRNELESLQQLGPRRRLLAECQADVMAASTLDPRGAGGPDPFNALAESMRFLGLSSHIEGTHPTRAQRVTAVRLGLTYATPVGSESDLTREEHASRRIRYLDLRAGESMAQWSQRACERALNDGGGLLEAIELENTAVRWNKDPADPFVEFSTTFVNPTQRRLLLEGAVHVVVVSRTYRDDLTSRRVVDTSNFSLVLEPKGSATYNTRLGWYGDSKVMPTLVFRPLEPDAFYSVRSLDSGAGECFRRKPVPPRDAFEVSVRNVLVELTAESATGFKHIRGAFTRDRRRDTEYVSSLVFPGAVEPPKIKTRAAETRHARFQLYAGLAGAAGSETFEQYRDTIGKWCSRAGVSIDAKQFSKNTTTLSIDNFARNLSVQLRHSKFERSTGTRFFTSLTVEPRRSPSAGGAPSCIAGVEPLENAFELQLAKAFYMLASDTRSAFSNLRGRHWPSVDDDLGFRDYPLGVEFPGASRPTLVEAIETGEEITVVLASEVTETMGKAVYDRYRDVLERLCPTLQSEVREDLSPGMSTYTIGRFAETMALEMTLFGGGADSSVEIVMKQLRN